MTPFKNQNARTILNRCEEFKLVDFPCGVYKDRYIVIAGGCRGKRMLSATMYDTTPHSHLALPDLPYFCRYTGVVLNDYFYVNYYLCIIRLSLQTFELGKSKVS